MAEEKGHLQEQILADIKKALKEKDVEAVGKCLEDMMERTLKQLLREDFNVNNVIQKDVKLLHIFIEKAPLKLTEAILKLGAKVDFYSLELALEKGQEFLQLLIDNIDIDERPKQCALLFDKLLGSRPSELSDATCRMIPMIIQHMSWSGDGVGGGSGGMGFKEVLKKHINLLPENTTTSVSSTVFGVSLKWPLIYIVARSGNSNLMKNWLECGDSEMGSAAKEQLPAVTSESNCLHGVCWCGHTEMAKTLIPHMSDDLKTSINSFGETPLMNAARLLSDETVRDAADEVLKMLLPSYSKHEERLMAMAREASAGIPVSSPSVDPTSEEDRHFNRELADGDIECQIHTFLPKGYRPSEEESLVSRFADIKYLEEKHFLFSLLKPGYPSYGDTRRNMLFRDIKQRIGWLHAEHPPARFQLSLRERAALIGVPDAREALSMYIAVWLYTNNDFYTVSMLKHSMSAVAKNIPLPDEDFEVTKARVVFLKPFIYYLQKALERFPSSIHKSVFFRGDSRYSAHQFQIGERRAFNIFTSSSRISDVVENQFVGTEDRRSCCFVVLGSGCDVSRMSFYPSENEELFRPDIEYRVMWIINPSLLRIFGCHFDIVMLNSLERSGLHEERPRELDLIRKAWCEISLLISKRLVRYVQPRLYKDFDSTELGQAFNDFIDELSEKDNPPPVMIQAGAGGGKSTAVVKVAGLLAGKDERNYLPLTVPMSSLDNAFDHHAIDDYIIQHVLPEDCCIQELVSRYRVVIILDSFDEAIANKKKGTGITNLRELNPTLLSESWVFVTCRTEHLIRCGLKPEDLLGSEVESRYLHPFNTNERDEFGKNMIRESKRADATALTHGKRQDTASQTTAAIESLKRQGIWDKLTSPLLLYMAVIAAMHRPNMVASSLSDIYEEYIESFIQQQVEADRKIVKDDRERVRNEARKVADLLARRMLETGRWEGTLSTYFQEEDMNKVKRVAKYLPVYYDVSVKEDIIRCHHKTLAEYLIARRVADSEDDEFNRLMSISQFAKNQPGIVDKHRYIQQSKNKCYRRQERFLKLILPATSNHEEDVITKASNAFSFLVSSGCTLHGVDLSGINLKHASFCGGCLVKVNFEGGAFDSCDFNRCQLIGCKFKSASVIAGIVDVTQPPISGSVYARSMFTPSGKHIVAVFDKKIELYLTATGNRCKALDESHKKSVSAIACGHQIEEEDLIIATCSVDDSNNEIDAVIYLWKPFVQTSCWGSITLCHESISFSDLSFSIDDAHIAAGLNHGSKSFLVVWKVTGGEQEFNDNLWIDKSPGQAGIVEYMQNGKLLYSKEGTIHIKTLSDDKSKYIDHQTISAYDPGVVPTKVTIPPVQTKYACAVQYFAESSNPRVWNKVPDRIDVYEVNEDDPSKMLIRNQSIKISTDGGIALSGCGQYLAYGGEQVVNIYDLTSKKIVKTLLGHSCVVMSIKYSSNGEHITTAGISTEDSTIRLWNTKGEGRMHEEGHKKLVTHLSLCGNNIASACQDNVIIIWNYESGAQLRRLPPLPGPIIALTFCKEKLFAIAKNEKTNQTSMAVWSTTTWKKEKDKDFDKNLIITSMAGYSDTMYVGSNKGLLAYDSTLKEIETPTTKQVGNKRVKHVTCQNDYVACVCEEEVLLFKKGGGGIKKFAASGPGRSEFTSLSLSSCCKFVIAATEDKKVFKWVISSGEETISRCPDTKAINPTFRGDTFVCGIKEAILLLSESESKLIGQNKTINAIAVSDDGKVIVSASDNLRVWRKNEEWELQYYLGERLSFSVKGGTDPTGAERMFAAARENEMN
eukprot:TRINITY_DN540_c0_g1_i1.p1 TRINITY_DN540_c0_g1~~TRINITY_DN540_c0_g1_i1.p1  ORF type:complete len:1789 (+),score=358.67 TRINITY_DN540_c0_g1_i1:111-5477(+)